MLGVEGLFTEGDAYVGHVRVGDVVAEHALATIVWADPAALGLMIEARHEHGVAWERSMAL